METQSKNSTAALINLSTLTQYFIPFGNLIFPILIWSTNKDKSDYVNAQGKQTINFQLSLFVYTCILAMIAIPILIIAIVRNASFSAMISHDNLVFDDFNFNDINGILTIAIVAVILFSSL